MGFEDEAEQSIRRPCHRANDRSKRPNELTSSIVPRGTSFHRSVELEFSFYWIGCCTVFMLLLRLVPGSSGTSLIGRLGSSTFRLSAAAVSMSLTGSCFSSESAPRPFHHGIRRRGGAIFRSALPSAGPSGHANSPHPSSREGHHSTARWSSSFLLWDLVLHGFHAVAACSRVQRNSVPSTQMRCMITANRRARATIAFFIPRVRSPPSLPERSGPCHPQCRRWSP